MKKSFYGMMAVVVLAFGVAQGVSFAVSDPAPDGHAGTGAHPWITTPNNAPADGHVAPVSLYGYGSATGSDNSGSDIGRAMAETGTVFSIYSLEL